MKQSLLEITKLSLRFGGLLAVCDLDLDVKKGQIVGVIGPNGAGKTTLFNAIAGIYQPSSGSIRFEGAELSRPLVKRYWFWWALLGVLVGFTLLLFVANVDGLWAATVKENYTGKEQGFSLYDARQSAIDYLSAKPRIERRLGRYNVSSHDGSILFGTTLSRADAETKRDAIQRFAVAQNLREAIFQTGKGFAIRSADGGGVFDEFPMRVQAEQRVRDVIESAASAARARRTRVFAFLLGLVLGSAGGFAVWRQTRRAPAWIAGRGIARTFQNIRLFQEMSVLDNVLVGMEQRVVEREPWYAPARLVYLALPLLIAGLLLSVSLSIRFHWLSPAVTGALLVAVFVLALGYFAHLWQLGAFSPHALRLFARARDEAHRLLDFVGLGEQAHSTSRSLAYGDQRRLEIARALATEPKLLLLDEPAAGMNPKESAELSELISSIRERGVTILLIEHHMRVVMGISDRVCVLDYGRRIAEGTPEEVRSNPKVIEAYLGKEDLG